VYEGGGGDGEGAKGLLMWWDAFFGGLASAGWVAGFFVDGRSTRNSNL
jgi:hypothetical protein